MSNTSMRRLVITAVLAGSSQSDVARTFGVSQGWISRLMKRYAAEGEAAFEPRSRAPRTSPTATAATTIDLVLELRKKLSEAGLDAGADTLDWHLQHHHQITLAPATINRILVRAGQVSPDPSKRPKSSYIPLRGRAAQRDLAVRLHPLPAHPPRRPARRRRRDHHLARRPLPDSPARVRTCPGHRSDRADHLHPGR
jgi:transposase